MTRDEIIAQELSDDPLSRGYASMSDEEARNDMNSEYRTKEQGVWLSDVWQYLSNQSSDPDAEGPLRPWPCLVMIKELAEDGTIQGEAEDAELAQTMAKNIQLFLDKASDAGGQLIWLDFNNSLLNYAFDKMVEVGILSQAQRDHIPTLSNVPQSRGAELGIGRLTTADITRNRNG